MDRIIWLFLAGAWKRNAVGGDLSYVVARSAALSELQFYH
jgi:hypothetical protein